MRSPKAFRILALVAIIGALLTACADSGSGDGQAATFVTGIGNRPEMLVRSFGSDPHSALVGLAIDEGLVRTTKDYGVVPALAESWDESTDGLSYTFHLRQNVKWHDGQPFTSADVVFSVQTILPLSPIGDTLSKIIASVSASDDHTVVLNLTQPFAPLLLGLGPQSFTIQPKHIYEGSDPLSNPNNRAPVGTGPYKFDSAEGDTITLVANNEYWGGAPKIERLVYKVIPDSNSRANALRSGEIDYINKFDVDATIVKALKDNKDITWRNGRVPPTFMTMPFNTKQGPLAKPEVRQALFRGLDRELMARSADPVYTKAARGSFPDNGWAVDRGIDFLAMYAYDTDAAAQALDAAGYPANNGVRFTLRLRYVPSQPYTQALAAVIAANWRDIGVETTLVQDDLVVWTDAIFKKNDYDVAIYSKTTLTDPEYGIAPVYECNPKNVAFTNPTAYCNSDLDGDFAEAAKTPDQAARTAAYARAQQVIAKDLPSINLLQMDQPDAIRSSFGGIDEFLSGAEHGDLTWSKLAPSDEASRTASRG